MTNPEYDLIVLGAGAAGLSVLRQLERPELRHLRVLLIDRGPALRDARTWCFWEQGSGPFEAVVHRRWQHLWIYDGHGPQRLDIRPYTYKMIRSTDLYRWMDLRLVEQPNLTRVTAEVNRVNDHGEFVTVHTGDRAYTGRWVLSSLPEQTPAASRPGDLLQHFQGWVVEAGQSTFSPDAATFMDFRVPQQGEVRFVYVLPLDETRALIEFTVFSAALLPQAEYDEGLRQYLAEVLRLTDFRVTDTEWGVIPMSDHPVNTRPSPRVVRIGAAGGCVKPSTGYTFARIQRQAIRIAEQLVQTGEPLDLGSARPRHAWMDRVLLRVLQTGRVEGRRVFGELFRRNSAPQVLRFLSEDSSLKEDLQLMLSVDVPRFAATGAEVTARAFTRRRR